MNLKLCIVFVIFAGLSAKVQSKSFKLQSRMLNANDAKHGQFPYMASIYRPDHFHHACGGAIISDRYVLSAAYCLKHFVDEPSKIIVYLGAWKFEKGAISSNVAAIKIHPDFDFHYKQNDIGLVMTVDQIVFSELVKPISLPTKDFPDKSGMKAFVSGFGSWFVSKLIQFYILVFYLKEIRENGFCLHI